jgi:hypothetical protein
MTGSDVGVVTASGMTLNRLPPIFLKNTKGYVLGWTFWFSRLLLFFTWRSTGQFCSDMQILGSSTNLYISVSQYWPQTKSWPKEHFRYLGVESIGLTWRCTTVVQTLSYTYNTLRFFKQSNAFVGSVVSSSWFQFNTSIFSFFRAQNSSGVRVLIKLFPRFLKTENPFVYWFCDHVSLTSYPHLTSWIKKWTLDPKLYMYAVESISNSEDFKQHDCM